MSVIDDKNVQVDWDSAPDIAGSEEGGLSPARLLPSKWNKDGVGGAWRLDVDIYEDDDLDDEYSVQGGDRGLSSDSESE